MKRELPTGTVTFLFTDVEGSTRVLAELGDGYAEELSAHRATLREIFTRHGGVEVDAQGDAFFVAFPTAAAALTAAVDARDAQTEGLLRARIGVHTGEPQVTDEGYFGLDVHRAARICAAGHGGQVLLSQATRELVDVDALDLGAHRLKDLGEPVRLFQLGRGTFPPVRSLNQTNLPLQPTPFLGREAELETVLALLRDGTRLLTLTGPGGTGKTRLAVQAAAELAHDFEDGVALVPLAPVRDPELVVPTIEQTLGTSDPLADYLRDRSMLLVLDNFEQVAEAAVELADVLAASARTRLLVTSRAPLRLEAEHEFPVPALPEPVAVELFVQRARSVRPDFRQSKAVLEICRRLDNLPLAIELAAARVRVLESESIVDRLDRRLQLLIGGARDLPARQQTLRAAIEWSFDLLEPDEQDAFARLCVFCGGWTADAVERVCGMSLDVLEALVENSLVQYESGRFFMLETIREYAAERLEDGDKEGAHRCHAAYFLSLAEEAEPELTGPSQQLWFDRLETDHANLRTALTWALDCGDSEAAFRVCFALRRFWTLRDYVVEAGRWFERTLAADRSGVPVGLQAGVLAAAGGNAFFRDDLEQARQLLAESIALFREAGDDRGAARALVNLANASDPVVAIGLQEEALELARSTGDPIEIAFALHHLGETLRDRGDFDAAYKHLEESVTLSREAGDRVFAAFTTHGLGDLALDRNQLDRAARLYSDALWEARRYELRGLIEVSLAGLASVAASEGETERAARLWGAVVALEDERGARMMRDDRRRYELLVCPEANRLPQLVAEGRELETDKAVEYALAPAG